MPSLLQELAEGVSRSSNEEVLLAPASSVPNGGGDAEEQKEADADAAEEEREKADARAGGGSEGDDWADGEGVK